MKLGNREDPNERGKNTYSVNHNYQSTGTEARICDLSHSKPLSHSNLLSAQQLGYVGFFLIAVKLTM